MENQSIKSIKGVGQARAEGFAKLGIVTLTDLLYHFPRDYEDRTQFKTIFEAVEGETVCIKATVFSPVTEKKIRKGMATYSLVLHDQTGQLTARWFNNRFVLNRFQQGEQYVFYGKVTRMGRQKILETPTFEPMNAALSVTGKIVPLYPLTAGLTQRIVQYTIGEAFKKAGKLDETLPAMLRTHYNLAEINFAMQNIHFPADFDSYEIARRRFVFEELFLLQLALLYIKKNETASEGPIFKDEAYSDDFCASLPFPLTNAQKKVLSEILSDFKSGKSMSRLVQGDVGSGKTVVAAAAMVVAAKNGYQSALMAPTEILANQHYHNFCKMMKNCYKVVLLTGSMSAAEKKKAYEEIASGQAQLIIGTHAIIQDRVVFARLGLVITDEQHRFGVKQRQTIAQKGDHPHVLVMTATPIPRTLALILYGDLDISTIDELPPGRQKVDTFAVNETMRERIYKFVRKQVTEGRQCYFICPLVEESESLDLKNVTHYTKNLSNKIFPDFKVALLHGKLPAFEKEQVMDDFKNGKIDLLVSTTVVEVGVDVPNANTMIVENAQMFGLSQLHQLRGRVGRGEYKSYCILFNESDNPVSLKRMEAMCQSNDGFYISEMDLKLRGPGDFFGTRQHGLPPLKVANLFSDIQILKEAQEAAAQYLQTDPILSQEQNKILLKRINELLKNAFI